MSQQRRYTISIPNQHQFAILWTRTSTLAREWASREWATDPVLIDVWPTTREDDIILQAKGQKEFYN